MWTKITWKNMSAKGCAMQAIQQIEPLPPVPAKGRRFSTPEATLGSRANARLAQSQPALGKRLRRICRKLSCLAPHRQHQITNAKAGQGVK